MTDLEMVRLCAEAMGFVYEITESGLPVTFNGKLRVFPSKDARADFIDYDPLHDDAQAMALVKRFRIYIAPHDLAEGEINGWSASYPRRWGYKNFYSDDLNRAIVECVAKMQKAKG